MAGGNKYFSLKMTILLLVGLVLAWGSIISDDVIPLGFDQQPQEKLAEVKTVFSI